MSPEAQAFEKVAHVLESLGVQYCIVGSVAAYSHGHGRATVDVDVIVAQVEPAHARNLVQELAQEYYISEEAVREAIVRGGSFNLIHHATGFKIDIFVRNGLAYERGILNRRERAALFEDEEPQFWIESAEDVVLSKLRWYRLSGQSSERQWSDVLGVLKMNVFNLDFEYLDHWATELRIADLLEKAFDEAGFKGNE